MMKRRVAVYVRVSTVEQAEEGYSIDAQVDKARKLCELQDKEVVMVYADRGISGKSVVNRLELQRLLKDAQKGLFDEVIVWKLNRLARNTRDLLNIMEELKSCDVGFQSVSEAFDTTTALGNFTFLMLGAIGEFERSTIVDNVKLGMEKRAKSGRWNGGRALGYKSTAMESKEDETVLEIVPEEALIVKEIFNEYSKGKGYKAIANRLNHKGYKTIRNKDFSVTTVSQILQNPLYIGKIRFNQYIDWGSKRRKGKNENVIVVDGVHEPIIDKQLWDKVREIHKSKSGKPSRVHSGSFPLTGILKCPVCGASMVAARTTNILKDGTRRSIRYYNCGNFKNKGSAVCKANGVRADYAEQYVFDRIREVIVNDVILKDIVENINSSRTNSIRPLKEELVAVEKKILDLQTRQERWLDNLEAGRIDENLVVTRLKNLKGELDNQRQRERELQSLLDNDTEVELIEFQQVKDIMSSFHQLLDKSPQENKKMLLLLLIKRVTITDRKKIDTIEIEFNEGIQEHLLNIKGESSNNEGSPSFYAFKIAI